MCVRPAVGASTPILRGAEAVPLPPQTHTLSPQPKSGGLAQGAEQAPWAWVEPGESELA